MLPFLLGAFVLLRYYAAEWFHRRAANA